MIINIRVDVLDNEEGMLEIKTNYPKDIEFNNVYSPLSTDNQSELEKEVKETKVDFMYPNGSKETVKKVLPKTGEAIEYTLMLFGILLVVLVVLFISKKARRNIS